MDRVESTHTFRLQEGIVHKYRRLEDMREGKDSAMFRMTTRQPSAEAVWTEANIGRQLSFNNYLSTQ